MARLFDDFEEFRKRLTTPAGSEGVRPGAGETTVPSTSVRSKLMDWISPLINKRIPSPDRWVEPAKPPVVATPTSLTPVQQPAKPPALTAPALSGIPSPVSTPVVNPPLPGIMNELPANSLRPSDIGRPAPLTFNGNTLTSINPNREARPVPVVAPAVNIAEPSRRIDEPMANAKVNELVDLLVSSSKTAMTEPDLLKRKYDIMGVKAIQDALSGITPLSTYGQYGATQTQAEVTKRGQDITARGQDLTAHAADVTAALKADENAMNSLYRAGLLKQGQEEVDVKKMLADAKNPQNYIKLVQAFSPKIKSINPETGEETETLDETVGISKARQFGFEPPETIKKGLAPATPPAGYISTGKTMNGKPEYYNAKTKRYWTP